MASKFGSFVNLSNVSKYSSIPTFSSLYKYFLVNGLKAFSNINIVISDVANRNGISEIAMSPLFYENVIELLCKENDKYKSWIYAHQSGFYGSIDYYHCNIIETGFDKWIEEDV